MVEIVKALYLCNYSIFFYKKNLKFQNRFIFCFAFLQKDWERSYLEINRTIMVEKFLF